VQDIDSLLVLMLTVSIFSPFYFSVIAACGIAVMTMMNCKKREKVFSSPYTKFLLGFLMIPFFVSATYNNYWGMLYSIVLIAGVISGFYVRSVMTRPLFNKMMDTAVLASVWCAGIAVYQKISCYSVAPRYRPTSAFHNANSYGMIIEFIIIIAIYRIFTNPRMKKLYLAVIALNMVGLYLCASLSAVMAVSFSVITILVFKGRYRLAGGLILFACAFVAVGMLWPSIFPRGMEAIDSTFEQRLSIWSTSMKGISLHPMLGTGPMSYPMVWERFGGYKTYHSHNLLLDTLLNFGIAGVASIGFYVFMQLKLLVLRFKNNICKNMNILLVALLVAVTVHGLTDVTIFWIQTGMLFLLIFSSTGIASEYLERKLRLPSLLPEYSEEAAAHAAYIKN
jgi:O-antigen ligase